MFTKTFSPGTMKMNNTPTKILVVDDDQSILGLIRRILESSFKDSILLTCCVEPKHAASLCSSEGIDILFTDLDMPDLNGFNLLKQVKTKNVLTQVIILSAQPTSNAMRSAFALGANDYLTKPIVRDQLIETTAHLIGQAKRWRRYMCTDVAIG